MASHFDRMSVIDASPVPSRQTGGRARPRPTETDSMGEPLRQVRPLRFAEKHPQTQPNLTFLEGWRKTIAPRGARKTSECTPGAASAERIRVWTAPVRQLASLRAYHTFLGPEDLIAIGQFNCSANRDCTIAGRVLLRTALSESVGNRIAPRDWRIDVGPTGKPVLAPGRPSLQFSISHTDDIAAVAISETLPVGIDLETVREGPSRNLIATCCDPSERLILNATAAHQVAHEFVRLWTLKEAYAKMLGEGHRLDFASFGFSLDRLRALPGAPHRDKYDPHFETMWISHGRSLSHLSLGIGFCGAPERDVDLAIMTLETNDETQGAIAVPGLNI